jgi:hypothetical protein
MRNYSDLEENFCRFSIHPRSHQFVVNTVAATTLYGLLFFPTVLLNGVSILTILRSSQLKKKVSYFLILLQSMIDLIFGAIALPLMIAYFIDRDVTREHSVVICWLHHTIGYYLTGLSVTILVALSFERYMGVVHPFIHRPKVTKRKIIIFLCSSGILFPIAVVALSLGGISLTYRLPQIMIVILLLFMVYVYTSIFVTARKRLNPANRPGALPAQTNASELTKKRRFIKEFKLAKSCFLVVCTFGLCFLPSAILLTPLYSLEPETYLMLWAWAYFLSSLNSCLNSIIFFWSKLLLRKEATNVMSKLCKSISHNE